MLVKLVVTLAYLIVMAFMGFFVWLMWVEP